jgi:molybdenum cofactor cytidylyltransferase
VQLIQESIKMPNKLICSKSGLALLPPAIFPSAYFEQLMNLTGDKGAKALLHQNIDNLQAIVLPKAIIDIDTKKDLINWHNTH